MSNHTSKTAALVINFTGERVEYRFAVAGSRGLTLMTWEDGTEVLTISTPAKTRAHYARLRGSGATPIETSRMLYGIAGSNEGYRPFVQVDGRRVYGNRAQLAA